MKRLDDSIRDIRVIRGFLLPTMIAKEKSIEERIDQLHADGIVYLHFDLPMDL